MLISEFNVSGVIKITEYFSDEHQIYLIKPPTKVNKLFLLLNSELHHDRVESIV